MLTQDGIGEPVVPIGHSAGGLHIRAHATRFSQDVVGLVFVDTSSSFQYQRLPPAVLALERHSAFEFSLLKSVMALGITRLAGQCTAVPAGFEAYAGWWKANTCLPAQVTSYQREASALTPSLAETAHTGPYGDLPVLVLSRDPQQELPPNFPLSVTPTLFQQANVAWDSLQEDLKHLSTHSHRIIARGSGHYIPLDRPDLLNREVAAFIQQIRSNATSAENGSTKVD